MSGLDRDAVEAWIRGEPGTVQAEDIAEDWLRKDDALYVAEQFIASLWFRYRYEEPLLSPRNRRRRSRDR